MAVSFRCAPQGRHSWSYSLTLRRSVITPGSANMKSVRWVVLGMLAMTAAPFAMAQEPAGKWTGIVKAPGLDIPLVLVVTKAADGKLSATVESPNQAPGMLMPV